jgi:hypothetical protein
LKGFEKELVKQQIVFKNVDLMSLKSNSYLKVTVTRSLLPQMCTKILKEGTLIYIYIEENL